jgi:ATP-dependent helicase YprA (DUF1998 family)
MAGVDGSRRAAIQAAWHSGQVQVVVATVAFGLGIDKSDVRFVLHATMSKSMESYYQESGRAARDHAVLMISASFTYDGGRLLPGEWARRARWGGGRGHRMVGAPPRLSGSARSARWT